MCDKPQQIKVSENALIFFYKTTKKNYICVPTEDLHHAQTGDELENVKIEYKILWAQWDSWTMWAGAFSTWILIIGLHGLVVSSGNQKVSVSF